MNPSNNQMGAAKWRNKRTGTIYHSVEFNDTPIATVTTDAGATFSVKIENLELAQPTQSTPELDEIYPELHEILTDFRLDLDSLKPAESYHNTIAKLNKLITSKQIEAELAGVKSTELRVIAKFNELCKKVRTDPNLGNSSKGKKDNFLDGAEVMLTEVQFHRHNLESRVNNGL